MEKSKISNTPHRRYNPLRDEWVLVSPQRTLRPWQGKKENIPTKNQPGYDPHCYICSGNTRANGKKNPVYKDTFVFDNDFPALTDANRHNTSIGHVFKSESVEGKCKVISFTPLHDKTLADLTEEQIEKVIDTWILELDKLNKKYSYTQIFENKGEIMGCSNPHPHGQIWAGNFIPNEIAKEDFQQQKYFKENNSLLLLDYLNEEKKDGTRLVSENGSWITVVPFWAVWPYETMLLPKKHVPTLLGLNRKEISDLAEIMKNNLVVYDKLFSTSMPYSMGWHIAPSNLEKSKYWQLHAHYYPPLLRSATVKKFMVGYEMLAESQRDITPEQAAERLSNL